MVSHRRLAVADSAAPLTDDGFNPHARAVHIGTLTLENGAALPDVVMTYECWGELNDDASNAVLVEHAGYESCAVAHERAFARERSGAGAAWC